MLHYERRVFGRQHAVAGILDYADIIANIFKGIFVHCIDHLDDLRFGHGIGNFDHFFNGRGFGRKIIPQENVHRFFNHQTGGIIRLLYRRLIAG